MMLTLDQEKDQQAMSKNTYDHEENQDLCIARGYLVQPLFVTENETRRFTITTSIDFVLEVLFISNKERKKPKG